MSRRIGSEIGKDPEMTSAECPLCHGDHWIDDETACGDEDRCSPMYPCPQCNPEGELE